MPCYIVSPEGTKKLVVKAFSTDLRSTMGSVQLRRYSSHHSRTVQQQSLSLLIQTKGPEDYSSLVSFLRKSQLHSLNETGITKIMWPERDMAYEVYVTNVPNRKALSDVAPTMQLTFGLITNLINTTTGAITGQDSSQYGNWLDTSIPAETPKPVVPDPPSTGGMRPGIR